jgi:hypothetical protein
LVNWLKASFGVLLLAQAACASSPGRADTKDTVLWRRVGSWSGHGNLQTGSFNVETGALRMQWETTHASAEGSFKVSLHSSISGRTLQTIVDHTGAGRDTTYIEDEPRVSYLVVESADVDWTMTLEEAMPATASPAARESGKRVRQ